MGPKKHLKRLNAPSHWMLDKLGGVFVSFIHPKKQQSMFGLSDHLIFKIAVGSTHYRRDLGDATNDG
jgi:hypothetical protein